MRASFALLLAGCLFCLAACSSGAANLQEKAATPERQSGPVELPQDLLAQLPAPAELPAVGRSFSDTPAD